NTIIENMNKSEKIGVIKSSKQLINWYDEEINSESKEILDKYYFSNDYSLILQNDCHKIGQGNFGAVYLNSSLNQTTSNQTTTQNFYSISNRVIKVIQCYPLDYLFFDFFVETIGELFKVKHIFNTFSSNTKNIVDIEKYFFDMETKTIYFVMKPFHYTLFTFVKLFPSGNLKGGKLKYDYENKELISVSNDDTTQKCNNDVRYPNEKLLTSFTSFEQKINITKQIVYGVLLIHESNIVHRDLKPENILINILNDEKLEVCITDFGLSVFNNEKTRKAGTKFFMPPETFLVDYEHKPTFSLDIFSLGIICLEIFLYSFQWRKYVNKHDNNNFSFIFKVLICC
ncbi:MAG: protein kinase, partial [bacterium]